MTPRIKSSSTTLDTLCWLIEEAFRGNPSHSLIGNLDNITEEDWTALPKVEGAPLPIYSNMSAGVNGCMKTTPLALQVCVATSHRSFQQRVPAHGRMKS